MEFVVQLKNITKVFQDHEALINVNLHIRKGEIYGFLGANGAGKSTIMKILMNMINPTSGERWLFGEKVKEESFGYLKRVGSMIEYPIFYENLTVRKNLELHCAYMGYHHPTAIEDALEKVGLEGVGEKLPKNLSLGMRQRLCVARAILTKPELLILDEPINGLDSEGIQSMRNLFQTLNKEYGMTILISSHIIGEIEQIADTIGIIKKGRVIEEISMEDIRKQNTEYIEMIVEQPQKAAVLLHERFGIQNFKVLKDGMIRIYDSPIPSTMISRVLILEHIQIQSIEQKRVTLEEYFLKKMKSDL
ncbi:MAG TPA: bacitracin ABC transporter ATP-binding protein [Bacillus bacterium]|uniref:ABC transporter ATP-binding protein n=1 Tax=Siminovitchia fordii TaxID=254759 RepID=UPI000379B7CB|nr:ATP-binding cassette domain-containing protein [Siminovitchia fordii]HBZ10494.1 bacitracin ABC transporter ATP-binding protein [Bacillus sp. (in: firmicutes)]